MSKTTAGIVRHFLKLEAGRGYREQEILSWTRLKDGELLRTPLLHSGQLAASKKRSPIMAGGPLFHMTIPRNNLVKTIALWSHGVFPDQKGIRI